MPKICYQDKNFRADKLSLIDKINSIIDDYTEQGYSLTLRQTYYQLVARGIIPNNERSYKNTGNLINDARLAGLIDWNAIVDRTRNLKQLPHWDSPQQIIESACHQYRKNMWENQEYYIEVWVEKEALSDVVGQACNEYDVPFFSCRGYVSQSEMWSAAQRFIRYQYEGKYCVLLHLGDHDPSGIDMSRDIEERLALFGVDMDAFLFKRIALNMEQIEEFSPPPNPAKLTDSRCGSYISKYGAESWELDALEPRVITQLIHDHVTIYLDEYKYKKVKEQVEKEKEVMINISNDWEELYDRYS